MEDLLASVKAWLQALAPRERYMVLGGGAACLVILLFAAWLPVERRVSRLEDSVTTKQADLAWLQSVAPQLAALRSAPPTTGGQSLVALVDQVARQTGVVRSLTGSQPGDDGTLSVRLEQVPFDALISWAGELVQHHGVRVVSANIDGATAVGLVSATFVLRGP